MSLEALRLAERAVQAPPEGFTAFQFPAPTGGGCTTKGLERVNKEIKGRTRVVTLITTEASCLGVVTGVALEISEESDPERPYLNVEPAKNSFHRNQRIENLLTNTYVASTSPSFCGSWLRYNRTSSILAREFTCR